MALEGTLKDFGLADIFQMIGLQKKTGVLTLKGPIETVHVLFLDGKIVYADSENKRIEDRLGTVLVNRRLITKEQLAEALEKQKQTLRRLGHILVNDGYMSREKMQEALYLQVSQILYRLFRWSDGQYKFSQEETIDYDEQNFLPIPPENILMQGMQMIDEWPIIEKKIRSFDMVFEKAEVGEEGIRIKEDEDDLLGDDFDLGLDLDEPSKEEEEEEEEEGVISLSSVEAEIYELVNGSRTVREITYRSSRNEFVTCRTLYDLLGRNLIAEVRKKKPAAADTVQAPVAVPRDRHPFLAALGYLFFLGVALVSLATFWMNPVNPINWFNKPHEPVTLLGEDITRIRLERLDYAVQVYELQYGALPGSLEDLVEKRFVSPRAILDPWGRTYTYRPGEDGDYLLIGTDSEGQADPDLIIHRPASHRPPAGRRGAVSPGS